MEAEPTTLEAFERALAARAEGSYRLRLYVSGSTPRSTKAIANIRAICEEHLLGRYELEVVDLYQQPHLAKDSQVIAAPTLVREMPQPPRKIIGDMSDEEKVLIALDIQQVEP
jgi:circadian clock protein KaiB